jgi:hypothetical protein
MSRKKMRKSAIALMTIAGGLAMASAPADATERRGKPGINCNNARSSRTGVLRCNARSKGYLDCNARARNGVMNCNARTRNGVMNCNGREGFLKCNGRNGVMKCNGRDGFLKCNARTGPRQ